MGTSGEPFDEECTQLLDKSQVKKWGIFEGFREKRKWRDSAEVPTLGNKCKTPG